MKKLLILLLFCSCMAKKELSLPDCSVKLPVGFKLHYNPHTNEYAVSDHVSSGYYYYFSTEPHLYVSDTLFQPMWVSMILFPDSCTAKQTVVDFINRQNDYIRTNRKIDSLNKIRDSLSHVFQVIN